MRDGLSTDLGSRTLGSVLPGPIFSGPVNRARFGSERHPTEIKQNILGVQAAWFAVPFAYLMDPRSNDQRTALCRLCEATIHGLLPHMCVDACSKRFLFVGREGR
ncbi:MAG: hypothetical protein ACI9AQ_002317 [Dinoroseobacter sp.]|jgi:hypothetical protein